MSERFEVKNFAILTGGLHTGDPVEFYVTYTIENLKWPWPPPVWRIKIEFEFNGMRGYIIDDLSGGHGSKDRKLVKLDGVMPRQERITGTVRFRGAHWVGFPPMPPIDAFLTTFDERQHSIPNYDDIIDDDNGDDPYVPPTVCEPGTFRCIGYDRYECIKGQLVLIERNSHHCGWMPTPPEEFPCPACPAVFYSQDELQAHMRHAHPHVPALPGNGIAAWFDRNKHIIIPVAVAVLVIALIAIIVKTRPGFRSPVKGFRSPIYTRRK